MKEIRAPKFANVIKYLNEACNKSLLTSKNVCSGTTDFNLEENYFVIRTYLLNIMII